MTAIAFTGPRSGFSDATAHKLNDQFQKYVGKEVNWMHGACTGADERFHMLLQGFMYSAGKKAVSKWSVELFPSNLPNYVATGLMTIGLGVTVVIHPPMAPLERNVLMARECNILWATPMNWIRMRSGTWHMVGQVEKLAKRIDYFVDYDK